MRDIADCIGSEVLTAIQAPGACDRRSYWHAWAGVELKVTRSVRRRVMDPVKRVVLEEGGRA
ncbi:MAG: hypothetical protein LBT97_03135 [Planctomycetota bacterium]|jgi:hypothetical protein|nr:hypothetical protein [Planctomycetota bacterium]